MKIRQYILQLILPVWAVDLQRNVQDRAHRFANILVQCLGICTGMRSFLHANGTGTMSSFVKSAYAGIKMPLTDHLGRSGLIEKKGHTLSPKDMPR